MNSLVLSCLIIAAVSLCVAVVAFVFILRFRRELKGWRRVTGTIIEVKYYPAVSGIEGDVPWHDCKVEFTDDRGRCHVVRKTPLTGWPDPTEGAKVPVVFPPSDPERARIGITRMVYGNYGAAVVLGLVLAGYVLILAVLCR